MQSIAAQSAFVGIFAASLWGQEPAGLKVGDIAPDFALQASDGSTYTLSKLRGKTVVLAWFPRVFTGGCTAQCRALRDSGDALQAFDVVYFMSSVDSAEQCSEWAKAENANFPILADPTRQTAEKYGILRDLGGDSVANRWTFYIDPEGKIAEIDKQVKTATAGEDTAAKLKGMKVPAKKPE